MDLIIGLLVVLARVKLRFESVPIIFSCPLDASEFLEHIMVMWPADVTLNSTQSCTTILRQSGKFHCFLSFFRLDTKRAQIIFIESIWKWSTLLCPRRWRYAQWSWRWWWRHWIFVGKLREGSKFINTNPRILQKLWQLEVTVICT